VSDASNRKQVPAVSVQFFGTAYFSKPVVAQAPVTPPVVVAPVPPPEPPKTQPPASNVNPSNTNVTETNKEEGIVVFREWLQSKTNNTSGTPYFVKLYLSNISGLSDILKASPQKYLYLDLSDSTFSSIEDNAFYNCTSLINIIIPISVSFLGKNAFSGCTNLANVTIPDGVTSIGEYAFTNCASLTSVTFKRSISSNNFSTLYAFPGDLRVKFYEKNKTDGTPGTYTRTKDSLEWKMGSQTHSSVNQNNKTPEAVIAPSNHSPIFTSVSAFKKWLSSQPDNTPANPYTVKLNVKSLSGIADFGRDSPQKYVYIDLSGSSIKTIPNYAFCYTHFNKWKGCDTLVGITIPDSISSIGEYAFYQCSSLTNLIIPNSFKSIGRNAFWNCYNLKSITIPDSVTSINGSAFAYCYSLASVTIGSGVTSISNGAFDNCIRLVRVTFKSTIKSNKFSGSAFPGNLHDKFYATNKTNGTPGTYTRASGGKTWMRQ
jgi:hypothetical protein